MNLSKQLIAICHKMSSSFTLNEKPISLNDVFVDTGLLPAIARRADQLCSLCFGYGIGVSFEDSDKALLGVRVIFDDITPNLLRYLCITDVLIEIIKANGNRPTTPLDELMYD